MTSSPRWSSPLIVVPVSILIWVAILTYILRHFFGAGVDSGWLIAGVMLTFVALGGLVIVREFKEAIPVPSQHVDKFPVPRRDRLAAVKRKRTVRITVAKSLADEDRRRSRLGLSLVQPLANRRRQG